MMDSRSSQRDIFLASLARCVESEEFIPAFYQRFIASSDVVRQKFAATDFEQQNKMLVRSLELVAAATVGDSDGLKELRQRASTHSRDQLDIEPELYQLWRAAAVATASDYDSAWNDDVAQAWERILSFAIDYMVKRY